MYRALRGVLGYPLFVDREMTLSVYVHSWVMADVLANLSRVLEGK